MSILRVLVDVKWIFIKSVYFYGISFVVFVQLVNLNEARCVKVNRNDVLRLTKELC